MLDKELKASPANLLGARPLRREASGMRTRILTIVYVGITIGFLLGMGVVALLIALMNGTGTGLEVTFTIFVGCMAAMLVWYVIKTTR